MKKFTGTLLFSIIALCILSQVSNARSSRPWKIGHVRSATSTIHKDMGAFTQAIADTTEGAIRFEIYPGNKLGDYSVVQERVSFGEVEMYVGPLGTSVDKKLALSFTPFLVDSWNDARRMYSSSSPMLKHMSEFSQSQNIKILGGYPVYFGGIALTEMPNNPADPDTGKDIIIRVPPMRSFELTARGLGYTPYPITWMYAKMGLKTGMVGGIIGGGAEGYAGLPNIRYYIPVMDHFEYWYIYMNLDLWKSLPKDQQQIISSAAAKMEHSRYAQAENDEKESLLKLEKAGIKVLYLSDEQLQQMREKIRREVWPVLRRDIGPAFDEIVGFANSLQ